MDFDRIFYVSFILRVKVVNVGHYNAKKSRLGTLKSFIVMLNPLAYVGMYGHHIRIGYRENKKQEISCISSKSYFVYYGDLDFDFYH